MLDEHVIPRRDFLTGIAGAGALTVSSGIRISPFPRIPWTPSGAGIEVFPREKWGYGLPPKGALPVERCQDVRFLIVHHTVSPNRYPRGDVIPLLRNIYRFHTGPQKRWSDVCYNFFVDRFGGIWEGRKGSLERPVKPDATGGSQGFSQICSFVGSHHLAPPSERAIESMSTLLGWLAYEYGIDPSPGSKTTFISRGSNKWPKGKKVVARTISGHRDMSLTGCPGNYAYPLLARRIPKRATREAQRLARQSDQQPARCP